MLFHLLSYYTVALLNISVSREGINYKGLKRSIEGPFNETLLLL